jgi:hypothetical protein
VSDVSWPVPISISAGRTLVAVLELLVGLTAGLLFVVGIVIMAGPELLRTLGLGRGVVPGHHPPPSRGELHPTTASALATSARLMAMLRERGMERHVTALRLARRRLQVEEARGIQDMRQLLRHLRMVRFEDDSDQRIFLGLVDKLRRDLDDRAQQLEILPRSKPID